MSALYMTMLAELRAPIEAPATDETTQLARLKRARAFIDQRAAVVRKAMAKFESHLRASGEDVIQLAFSEETRKHATESVNAEVTHALALSSFRVWETAFAASIASADALAVELKMAGPMGLPEEVFERKGNEMIHPVEGAIVDALVAAKEQADASAGSMRNLVLASFKEDE